MKSLPLLASLQSATPMTAAIAVSVVLHAALITTRFVDPEAFNRIFEDTALEVILVNARSDESPDPKKAQAIAQSSLAGGGDHDDWSVRATSPLPPSLVDSTGVDLDSPVQANAAINPGVLDLEAQHQQIQAMQREQMALLAQVKQQIAALPTFDTEHPALTEEEQALEQRRSQLIRILGEIERRIQEENARPRKRYISPATMRGVQALYYDSLKQKIEDRGTANFPEHNGQKLYGELIIMLTVNHDGRVLETQVMTGSGNRLLDRRAEAIAVGAGPFDTFDKELRRYTDQLVIVSRFKFARNNTLQAQFSASAAPQHLIDSATEASHAQ